MLLSLIKYLKNYGIQLEISSGPLEAGGRGPQKANVSPRKPPETNYFQYVQIHPKITPILYKLYKKFN